jgi:6-phosphogluconolactonase
MSAPVPGRPGRPAGTSLIVCPDPEGVALRALDLMAGQLAEGLRRRGEAHLALTGGSSASHLYRAIRTEPRARRIDWSRVHLWQGDDRFVPAEHPDSNWGVALREWLESGEGPDVPASNRHPVPVEEALRLGRDERWAAERYEESLVATAPRRDGLPSLEVILLGMGGDGHILSAFPGGAVLRPGAPLAMGVPAPQHITPHLPRVTLSPLLLRTAGLVLVMVPGASKGDAVREAFATEGDPEQLPARLAVRPNAVWLLDAACAAAVRDAARPA